MEENFNIKKQQKKYTFIVVGLSLLNLLAFNLYFKEGGYDHNWNFIEYSIYQNLKSSLIVFLFIIPLLCLLLGLLFSVIPYKKLSYSEKYLRTSLIISIGINALIVVYQFSIIAYRTANSTEFNKPKSEITIFKNTMTSYKDSAIFYFDSAIDEVKKTDDIVNISFSVSPHILRFGHKIDSLSRIFHTQLKAKGLNQKDYEKAINELTKSFKELDLKKQEFEATGLFLLEHGS